MTGTLGCKVLPSINQENAILSVFFLFVYCSPCRLRLTSEFRFIFIDDTVSQCLKYLYKARQPSLFS